MISNGGIAISVVPVWCGPSATAGGFALFATSVASANNTIDGVAAPDPENVFRLLLGSLLPNLFTRTVVLRFVDK